MTSFSQSRRYERRDGPYEVPGNPAAENRDLVPAVGDAYNRPGTAQPSLWCQWVPALDGRCLTYDGREKFCGAAAWMRYLLEHPVPGALARTSTNPLLSAFTFDHVADGVIAAGQRDTGELYAIRVRNNHVTTERLWVPRTFRDGILPYEIALDELQADFDRW